MAESIRSALEQTYNPIEVIVVDDGSTDSSVAIATGFGSRIQLIAKENGGQASAFNVGFNACRGDWILFLDSDDFLKPEAVEVSMRLTDSHVAKVHFPLRTVHQRGSGYVEGGEVPGMRLSEGDALATLKESGSYVWPPTSGNLFSKRVLEQILPMEERDFKLCADLYLCLKAVAFGRIAAFPAPLGFYRIHGRNGFSGFTMDPAHLATKARNLALAEKLTNEVSGCNSGRNVWRLRGSVELAVLAHRFGETRGLEIPDLPALQVAYWDTFEYRDYGFIRRITAGLSWVVLRYFPKFMAAALMHIRVWKATRVSA